MKFIRILKANEDLNGYTLEETGKGDAYHIYKDNNTGKYRIYNSIDEEWETQPLNDISEAESMLEDLTEDVGDAFLYDLANDLLLDFEEVKQVEELLSKVSYENSGYGKIMMSDLEDISNKVGVSIEDVQTIASELMYNVE